MNKDNTITNIQLDLLKLADTESLSKLTCNSCEHRQRWQCNSKVFQYCGVRKSKLTDNGLLKIKCKTPACSLYKQIKGD